MKITINTQNEYPFYPDVQDNLDKPAAERFTIILQRVGKYQMNRAAFGISKDGGVTVDSEAFLRESIKGMKNAPMLENEKGDTSEMTIDDLVSIPELGTIATQAEANAWKLYNRGELEVKNL